jgi:hypothetical protein
MIAVTAPPAYDPARGTVLLVQFRMPVWSESGGKAS